jgi:hypothetical protein
MNTYNRLTKEDYQLLADLWNKRENVGLTAQEQALLDELRAKDRSQVSAAQIETLREAARQTAKLVKCGLTLAQLAFHREILDRLEMNDTSITPEQMREFEDVCRRIDRCLRGRGDPPDSNSGPDDSGPSITAGLGAQPVEDDEEAKPAITLPAQELVPVQVPLVVKPEDEKKKKTKPLTRVPTKRSGVDFP